MDSGFRRGSDVVKALALGAHAVMVGRAPLHGDGGGGEAGARRALEIYRDEIDRVLALIGCRGIADLNRDCLLLPGEADAIAPAAPRLTVHAGAKAAGEH